MFVDYLTLMMVDLIAGLGLLAYYLYARESLQERAYAAGFGAVGLLGLILGLGMVFTWPLPGSYNILFGEAMALFGLVFLAAGVALGLSWDLRPVGVFAFFAGFYAILGGARILSLGLTREPLLSGLAFILAGLVGLLALPLYRLVLTSLVFRRIAALGLVAVAILWGVTFANALWGHLETFREWLPLTMR